MDRIGRSRAIAQARDHLLGTNQRLDSVRALRARFDEFVIDVERDLTRAQERLSTLLESECEAGAAETAAP